MHLLIFVFVAVSLSAADMQSRHAPNDFPITADPNSAAWKGITVVVTSQDRYGKPIDGARTEIRSRWTAGNLYFLFISNYQDMYLRENPSTSTETYGIWDWDVVEVFIGSDLSYIGRYFEFEVTPQGEWVDLDIDRRRQSKAIEWTWNSGFRSKAVVDRNKKIWYCEMQIPWKAIEAPDPKPGQEFRLNLYRIEGALPIANTSPGRLSITSRSTRRKPSANSA
jgi:hypothetical protein